MAMTFRERKAALTERGIPQAAIARKVGFSEAYVHQVLKGERRSETIEALIAKAIERPLREVFPPREDKEREIAAALK